MKNIFLLLALFCGVARADINLSLGNVNLTADTATFDVIAKATASHDVDTYGIKINALELTDSGPLTLTAESNLLPGFTLFDTNDNGTISVINGKGRGPGSNTIGFHAASLGSKKTFAVNESVPLSRFTFRVTGGFKPTTVIRLAIVTTDPGMDTGFARIGAKVPTGTATGTTIPPAAEPTLVEVLTIFRDASGKLFLRFNGQTVPINQ